MNPTIRHGLHWFLALALGLGASTAGVASASVSQAAALLATSTPVTLQMRPGDRLSVRCSGLLSISGNTILCDPAATATASPVGSATRTARATRTPTRAPATATRTVAPSASPTPTRPAPTSTRTVVASATPTTPPTATAPAGSGGAIYDAAPIAPEILGTCSAAVHDRYVAIGPDGVRYRTWHPQVVDNGAGGTCTFAHEHGVDPTTSTLPNAEPIVFDYVAHISELNGMPMPEPHEGFKIHVVNAGQLNDEGRVSRVSAILLFHMGTGGVKRYVTSMHTLAVQAQMPDGSRVNVRGMADTGSAGSICARDRGTLDIGRTVMTLPGVGESANGGQACVTQSPYEIWQFTLSLTRNLDGESALLQFIASLAAFDPITTMDPGDVTRSIYSGDAFPGWPTDPWRGCDREFYVGSALLRNAVAPQVWTDAHGNVLDGAHTPADALLQVIPLGNVFDARSSAATWQTLATWPDGSDAGPQVKLRQPTCADGLGARN